jgi:hypothetical protein
LLSSTGYLGEEAAAAGVQAAELGVLLGRAGVADLQREAGLVRRVVDHQQTVFVAEGHAFTIGQAAQQGEVFTVQAQRLAGRCVGIALDEQLAGHDGLDGVEVEAEVDAADPERRGGIVFTPDHGG